MKTKTFIQLIIFQLIFAITLFSNDFNLTKEEQQWLKDHPKIRVLNEVDWPPYDFDINGKASGYSIEYIQELAKLIGIELEFVKGSWSELLKKFENKQIDLIHVFNKTKERQKKYLFTNPYLTPSYAITKRKDDHSIQQEEDLKGKIIACGKGWSSTKVFKQTYPESIVKEYDNISDMLKAVAYGEVDAALDDFASTYYHIVRDKRVNLQVAFEINTAEEGIDQNYYLAVHKEDKPLQTILNKALETMPEKTLAKLNKKWFGENNQAQKKIRFTQKEKAWLATKPIIKYSEVNWKPLSIIENNSMTGIMGDYLKIVSINTGIEFKFVSSKSWLEVLEKFKTGQIDLVPGIGNTPEELSMGSVSKKYATFPMVIVTNNRIDYVPSLDKIRDKTFAVPKYYTSYNYLKNLYPDTHIIETSNIFEALLKVSNGDADVFIGHIAPAIYYMSKIGKENLKVVGNTNFSFEHHYLIDPKQKEFLSVVNKVFDTLSEKERESIYNDWVRVKIEQKSGISTQTILSYAIPILVVISFLILSIIYWNRKLKRVVNEKTKELRSILKSFDKNVIASKTDEKGFIVYASEAFCEISGYSKDEFLGSTHAIVRHPDTPKELFVDMWKTIKKNKVWKGELKNRRKDGSFYWVEMIITPECDSNNNFCGYSAIRQDITAKKEVEELSNTLEKKVIERTTELNDERKYIQSIMNSQTNIVISSDGTCLKTANKAFLNFYKVKTINEFLEKFGDCICDTFDTDNTDEFIQKFMGEEKWLDYIYNRANLVHKAKITKDNKEYIFTITADKFHFNGNELKTAVFNDITEMEEIRKNIELILSNVMLPVLITSIESRTILYANSYAEKQYEVPMEQLVGSKIDDIYIDENQREEILKEIAKKGYVEGLEQRYKTKKGKEFSAILSVKPIIYQGEDAYIGMVVDITKQKKIEAELRDVHKHTRESIEYASLIQGALIPNNNLLSRYFQDHFTIWEPKDIVGGDVYLFEELSNTKCLLMVIDCTGHGVPGAFVTMLVKAIERQITAKLINSDEEVNPAEILSVFNINMKHLLKQESQESISNAGFDGGILYYDKETKIIKFAGAETPLFYIDEQKELKMIKGDRHSIGYKKSDTFYQFTEHTLEVKEGMQFYLTTDGYLDQNGGKKGFCFGKKNFQKLLLEIQSNDFITQKNILMKKLEEYQGANERNDDVTLVGFKI